MMNGKNLFRLIVWLMVLTFTGGALAFAFRAKHGEDYNVSPNVTCLIAEVACFALLTLFCWFLATNRSENAFLSKIYGFIASHGFLATLIYIMIIVSFAFMFFGFGAKVVSKDGYSSFIVPVPFIPACALCALAFGLPPVQVSHWSRKNEGILTVLLTLIRVFLILGMVSASSWMWWYSF